MLVRDLLEAKREPVTIEGDQSVFEAMQSMVENEIGSLIVVNQDDTPIGIITESDIFMLIYQRRGDMPDLPVRENMSTDLILGVLDDDLGFIAEVMIGNNIQHIPIMDETEKLCGIVSMRDLVRSRQASSTSRPEKELTRHA
jgi:CBS domain-containing protein